MNKPTSGETAAQLAANPKLIRAYQCVREAAECLDDYISEDAPKSNSQKGEMVWRAFRKLDGVLPNFWSNLSEMIVADINANIKEETSYEDRR